MLVPVRIAVDAHGPRSSTLNNVVNEINVDNVVNVINEVNERERQGSNLKPLVLETSALPVELHSRINCCQGVPAPVC